MWLDHGDQVDDELAIEGLVEISRTQQVPGMNNEVDETEPQESSGRNIAARARDGLVERRRGEGAGLLFR